MLRVTIPENLNYTEVFDDIFDVYTNSVELEKVKTTNLGSMYELSYAVSLKDESKEKEMIDAIRCRNGNLTIICGKMVENQTGAKTDERKNKGCNSIYHSIGCCWFISAFHGNWVSDQVCNRYFLPGMWDDKSLAFCHFTKV